MTGQERILCAMRGETPDRIPWAPNLNQWFYGNKFNNTLPDDLDGCTTPTEAIQWLGGEVLTRWDGQIKGRGFPGLHTQFSTCRLSLEYEGKAPEEKLITAFNDYTEGTKIHRKLETPHGTLSQTWRFTEESCADFEEAFWWKDFEKDYPAIRTFIEDRHYGCDTTEYDQTKKQIGDSGFVMQELPENPLKMMHWLCGPERAIYLLIDHGPKLKELFDIHTRKTLEFTEQLLEKTDTKFFISNDNLDAMLFPPYYFDDYLYDHYIPLADLIHSKGGYFWVHSCGNNLKLAKCIKKCKIDCMEGLTHPPLGDFPLHEAHERIGPDFVVDGGNSCHEQELFDEDGPQKIRDFSKNLFKQIAGNPHFIFASSCNTSPRTPWQNILAMRDAAANS